MTIRQKIKNKKNPIFVTSSGYRFGGASRQLDRLPPPPPRLPDQRPQRQGRHFGDQERQGTTFGAAAVVVPVVWGARCSCCWRGGGRKTQGRERRGRRRSNRGRHRRDEVERATSSTLCFARHPSKTRRALQPRLAGGKWYSKKKENRLNAPALPFLFSPFERKK